MATLQSLPRPDPRGDVMVRGFGSHYPGLWERFMRAIRQRRVDQPRITTAEVIAPLIERWLNDIGEPH